MSTPTLRELYTRFNIQPDETQALSTVPGYGLYLCRSRLRAIRNAVFLAPTVSCSYPPGEYLRSGGLSEHQRTCGFFAGACALKGQWQETLEYLLFFLQNERENDRPLRRAEYAYLDALTNLLLGLADAATMEDYYAATEPRFILRINTAHMKDPYAIYKGGFLGLLRRLRLGNVDLQHDTLCWSGLYAIDLNMAIDLLSFFLPGSWVEILEEGATALTPLSAIWLF